MGHHIINRQIGTLCIYKYIWMHQMRRSFSIIHGNYLVWWCLFFDTLIRSIKDFSKISIESYHMLLYLSALINALPFMANCIAEAKTSWWQKLWSPNGRTLSPLSARSWIQKKTKHGEDHGWITRSRISWNSSNRVVGRSINWCTGCWLDRT